MGKETNTNIELLTFAFTKKTDIKPSDDSLNKARKNAQLAQKELQSQLSEAEVEINRAILSAEAAKYAKNEKERYQAMIDAGRAFQSYRLCVSRATTIHASIYGANGDPLFSFTDPQQTDGEWNQNVENTFDLASFTYGPLVMLDLFTEAKTKLQIAKKRHRVIDALTWLTLNIIRAGNNDYNSSAMTNLIAGTLLIGYAIDLVNQYFLDTKELALNIENTNKIKPLLPNDDYLTKFNELKLDEEIIPADELKIYLLLKNRCKKAIASKDQNEINQASACITQNLNRIQQSLEFQNGILNRRLVHNELYAGALLVGAFLIFTPAGMGIIVAATILNQVNGFHVNWLNYERKITDYKKQLDFLDGLNLDTTVNNDTLVDHNLRPMNENENLTDYILEQKLHIHTKINQANRLFILHSAWYVMNISLIIILVACPVANIGFAATIVSLMIYGLARKYCLDKNVNETKETELYTQALCIMSAPEKEKMLNGTKESETNNRLFIN